MKLKKYFPSVTIIYIQLLILCAYPYVFRQFLPIPTLSILYGLCLFVNICLLYLSKCDAHVGIPNAFRTLCYVQGAFYLFGFFYHSDSSYLFRIFYLLLTYTILLLLVKKNNLRKFIIFNNKFITVQAVLGFVAFILIFLNILQPLFTFENMDSRLSTCYGLTCGKGILNIQRICGYFDEPGSLAFWGIYALILNKLYVKDKKIELLLIIGLTSTLSMAYFIQLGLYLLAFYTKRKYIKYLIGFSLLIGGLMAYVYYIEGVDSELFRLTFGRFGMGDYDLDNNREDLMELAEKMFRQAPLLGNGETYISTLDYMGDNPFETLAVDGIMGTVMIYLPLIVLAFSRSYSSSDIKKAILILCVGYLQRPFHFQILHFVMLYLFVLYAYQRKYENTQSYSDYSM